jgi:signal transduction histidine kinase
LVARNIATAKNQQKIIDSEKEEQVAKDISLALNKHLLADARQQELKHKQISEAREDARETERSDIGKELHDNVNQLLGASRMYLELGTKGGTNSQEYFSRSSEYMLTAIEEIRKLTRGLITDIIKNLGLCEGIENLCRDIMEITSLKISLDLKNFSEQRTDDKFKLNIFRIIQEQINNIIKHAGARNVLLSLSHKNNSVFLSIADDGVGFDTATTRTGVGIDNITSRAAQYNGTVNFTSQPKKGCLLAIKFKTIPTQA